MEDLTEIYNELIMEHGMNSYNKKDLKCATCCKMGHNPNCGDEIKLQLKFKANGEYRLGFNDTLFKEAYKALPGRWIGGKIGIYAKGKVNGGYGLFKYFKVREAKR